MARGMFIALDIIIDDNRITLITIYGPNNDNADFVLRVIQFIEDFENEQYLICGNFNLVLDRYLDTKDYFGKH